MIYFEVEDTKFPLIKKQTTKNWIKSVAEKYGKKVGNITYIFCSDEKILEVNKEFLQHDYYTDIITFDDTEGNTISGDIFISLDTVKSNSEKFQTSYLEELHRVIIHGILHLCGLKDKSPKDEKMMREAENQSLKSISF